VNRAKRPRFWCSNKWVPCGTGDDPPNDRTKPLLAGAKPARLLGTAKLAAFTGASAGKSSTASNVTQADN